MIKLLDILKEIRIKPDARFKAYTNIDYTPEWSHTMAYLPGFPYPDAWEEIDNEFIIRLTDDDDPDDVKRKLSNLSVDFTETEEGGWLIIRIPKQVFKIIKDRVKYKDIKNVLDEIRITPEESFKFKYNYEGDYYYNEMIDSALDYSEGHHLRFVMRENKKGKEYIYCQTDRNDALAIEEILEKHLHWSDYDVSEDQFSNRRYNTVIYNFPEDKSVKEIRLTPDENKLECELDDDGMLYIPVWNLKYLNYEIGDSLNLSGRNILETLDNLGIKYTKTNKYGITAAIISPENLDIKHV